MYHIHKPKPRRHKVNILLPLAQVISKVVVPLVPFVPKNNPSYWDNGLPQPDKRRANGGSGYHPRKRTHVSWKRLYAELKRKGRNY